MREQVELLKHHANFRTNPFDVSGVIRELDPVDDNGSFLMNLKSVDASDEGRFARARRPEDNHHLAILHGHIDTFQRLKVIEPFTHTGTHDHVVS